MVKAEHVIPRAPTHWQEMQVVGMIQELTRPVSSGWIDWIERSFMAFGAMPLFGAGSTGDVGSVPEKRSSGKFSNINKKLKAMFADPRLVERRLHADFGTSAKGESIDGDSEQMHVSLRKVGHRLRYQPRTSAYWRIREPLAHDPLEVAERMLPDLISTFRPLYGFLTLYPAAWDWSCPAWGTNYDPIAYGEPGYWDPNEPDNRIYNERVFRAPNDREWDYRPEKGWLREVYTVNLINDRHLAAPFRGRTLGDYIALNGELGRNLYDSPLHLWHVPDDVIDRVRNDLEHSGLILASETEPMPLPD